MPSFSENARLYSSAGDVMLIASTETSERIDRHALRLGGVNLRLRSESVCAMSVNPLGMRAAVLAGTVLLSACTTVGPDFKRPQVPPGSPTGRAVPSSRWPLTGKVRAAGRRRSGGATSTIPCSTSWLPRRSA